MGTPNATVAKGPKSTKAPNATMASKAPKTTVVTMPLNVTQSTNGTKPKPTKATNVTKGPGGKPTTPAGPTLLQWMFFKNLTKQGMTVGKVFNQLKAGAEVTVSGLSAN